MCHQDYKPTRFSEPEPCPYKGNACTRKGETCVTCWTQCNGPPVELAPHKFSGGISGSSEKKSRQWFPQSSSEWIDDDTFIKPFSELEKLLASMLRSGVPIERVNTPKEEPSLKLPRTSRPPVVELGTTPVPNMPGVRVWVTNATEILETTGIPVEMYPDDPWMPNTYQGCVTTVYLRFRIEGKLEGAGAGYWLAPSLSALVTSVYVGLAFAELTQEDVVDVGIIKGQRTVLQGPFCYSARVASPDHKSWSCKKGNIYTEAQRVVSFRLGDVGVGHPDWVEATKNTGGMNSRSQGADVAHNRLLVIMTELLTTRILQVINTIK